MNTKVKIHDPEKARAYFETKMAFTTGPVELERAIKEADNVNVIDVRGSDDYEQGHIPGAFNLPKDKWETNAGLNSI